MRSFTRALAAAAFLAFTAAACTGTDAGAGMLSGGVSSLDFSTREAQQAINAYRARHGLKPVSLDSALARAAASHSRDMARHNSLSHSISAGSVGRRVSAAGGSRRLVAENLSAGRRTVKDVVAAWSKSPGHKRNLLLRDVDRMGIAAVYAPETRYKSYWTLILASGD